MRSRFSVHPLLIFGALIVFSIVTTNCGTNATSASRTTHVVRETTTTAPTTTTTAVPPTTAPYVAPVTTPQAPPIQAAIFGDSLITNANPYLIEDLGAMTSPGHILTTVEQQPGSALCQFLPQMQTIATTIHPQVVALEFAGNAFSPCISNAQSQGFSAVVAQYQADLSTAINIFLSNGTAHVIVIGAPVPSATSLYANFSPYADVKNMYASFVPSLNNPAVTYFDASPWVEDPVTHSFTQYLPCKPLEIWTGNCTGPSINGVQNNIVRYSDGAHLCAQMAPNFTCVGYASGAWRMANAISTAIAEAFNPQYAPLPTGP